MSIWNKEFSLELINSMTKDTATQSLGIEITKIGDDYIEGEMPVDNRTKQLRGLLHGGASALLAETLGSLGGYICAKEGYAIVGMEINANHISGVKDGVVVGVATPIHIGRTTQVWDIKIKHKETKKLVCISRLTLAVIEIKE